MLGTGEMRNQHEERNGDFLLFQWGTEHILRDFHHKLKLQTLLPEIQLALWLLIITKAVRS